MQQQTVDLQQNPLQDMFSSAQAYFKYQIPSEEQLQKYFKSEIQRTVAFAGFGVGETLALLTLLFEIWKEYGPSSMPYSLTCKQPFEGHTCDLEFTSAVRIRNHTHLYCERGHETIHPPYR